MSTDDSEDARPSGAVKPCFYNCTWNLDGQEIQGTIELAGGKFPHGTAKFMLASCGSTNMWAFPRSETRDRVTGYIDAIGRTVVLVGVTVTTHLENLTYLDADYALVGRGLGDDHDLVFHEVRFQTTGLELLAGFVPLTHTEFPRSHDDELMEWSAKCEGGMFREWRDDSFSVELDYAASATVLDPYRFGVRFAPWATINSQAGNTVREWYRSWCTDLLMLASAATGRPETLTHMQFTAEGTTVTVFTAGVTQSPYYASQDLRTHVCYTVGGEGGDSLLDVLRRVQTKRDEGHPLIDGYDPVVLDRAQHPRSRVLQLVQWIEAAHGFETRETWQQRVDDHAAKRTDLVTTLTAARGSGVITTVQLSFAKSALSKKPYRSLDEALRAVLDRHPGLDIRRRLGELPVVQAQLAIDECDTVECAVRSVRNGLSHGIVDYDVGHLDQLAGVLRHLVRADYLWLLGCAYKPKVIFPPGE